MPRLSVPSGRFALFLPFLLGACAEERPPINRVQPNALEKSFFVGANLADPSDDPEFYSAATVIDVPFGVDHGLFSGLAGGLKRLKWEIAEDRILARATHETFTGADGRGSRRTNNGQVIAAFPITSHFDIRRSYNTSTGEELNVIEENTTDRPWYERSFFRVDWSINLITSSIWWDPLSQNTLGGVNYGVEPLSYYVSDPANPDAPVFSMDEGYFDVTQKVYVTPKELTLDGQTLPTCLWRGALVLSGRGEEGTCESSEIKVRMSFLRVKQPGERDYQEYEPLHWDGARMDAFGIFTQDRKGYDNHYGVVDEAWYRFAQRYNIWEETFAKDASGKLVGCAPDGPYDSSYDPTRDTNDNGTDDECESSAPAGSQCNPIVRACTLPFAHRTIRTVAWHHHMSNEDRVIVEQSRLATEEWDTAMRTAVQAARHAECRRTRGDSTRRSEFANAFVEAMANNNDDPVAACEATFFIDQEEEAELKNVRALNRCWNEFGRYAAECEPRSGVAAMKPVIAFCHNPVAADDDPACGERGTVTRVGDLRYHSINIWPTPEDSSPWGFGPSWADPLTGEIIQASINVYNAVTDERAQRIVDKARWYAGELPTGDVLSGQYVRDRIRAANSAEASRQFVMSKEQVDNRLRGMLAADARPPEQIDGLRSLLDPVAGPHVLKRELLKSLAPPPVGGSNVGTFNARIEAVKNSPLEAQLVGPMWYDAVGVNPATTNAQALELVSPLRSGNARKIIELQDSVQRRLAQNGMCLYEADAPEPSSMPALGRLLSAKFGDYDPAADPAAKAERANRMWDYVRAKMHYGVLLHEMGHTIGERHNFTSSFDKFNYRPQYWQLRTKLDSTGPGVTTECTDSTTDPTGEDCVGPRYFDPLTQREIDHSIYTWAQTTVMDYSGELTHDWLGLGIYDYAAARMFYGDVVDVRKDLSCPAQGCANPPVDRGSHAFDFVDFPGFLISQTVDVGTTDLDTLHYSMWNSYFPLVDGCRPATEEELSPPPDWNEDTYGAWDPVFDGEIINGEVCRRPRVHYYTWRELQPDLATDPSYVRDPKYYSPRRARTRDDGSGRSYVRVPYSFGSDDFRDGWSSSILTRDAGADVYEQTLWFINQYENGHIWNNFRNGRTGFSIVGAYRGELDRFHMKLANFAQGLSIIHDYYASEIAKNAGIAHSTVVNWYEGEGGFMREQAVAAGAVFDHFLRVLTRPQTGLHYTMSGSDGMYMAEFDRIGSSFAQRATRFQIPNGTTFLGQDVTFGGRPLNNGFAFGQGYWYYDYIAQAGSYYEKTYAFDMMLNAAYRAPYAFTRWDGIDGRWQFTNFANLFPEGIRRLIGVMLTEDFALVAPRVTANDQDQPHLTEEADPSNRVPLNPIGWVSFVPKDGPEHCFPTAGNYLCRDTLSDSILANVPAGSVAVEPQLGFEIQKFLAFWTYVYMPDSQVLDIVDMMRIWKIGEDIDPSIAGEYVGWIDPETNIRYYARAYGDELIFGKTYDKGIAAKMLQWADRLTRRAYVIDSSSPAEGEGAAIVERDADGRPLVAPDPSTAPSNDPPQCSDNRYCTQLRDYRGLIDFVRDLGHQVGFLEPELPTIER